MDLNSLRDQVSNLTLYDLKAGVRKVQNAVMNYTEMEAKVREATNNEPWGASSTMMQEIANSTFNYQLLNEIMPMIYKRFTEKSAEEWRQIYKALQLMEFLVKNGSERVIDDARSHLSLLKMLRQFHYIDPNGKDQGLNVRNRSKELTDLLSDVEKIRSERKRARATKNKYSGVEGGAGLGSGLTTGGSSRYGGFGSESGGVAGYGGPSGGVYGDGGGFGGQEGEYTSESRSQSRGRDQYDEYNEYDEGAVAPTSRRKAESGRGTSGARRERPAKKVEAPKPKAPEVDLFDFGDDDMVSAAPIAASNGKQAAALPTDDFGTLQAGGADDDDFDDFQSATPSMQAPTQPAASFLPPPAPTSTTTTSTQYAQPQPRVGAQNANFSNLFATTSPVQSQAPTPSLTSAFASPAPPQQQQSVRPTGYQAAQPNYYTSVSVQPSQPVQTSTKPSGITSAPIANKPKSSGGDAFAALLGGTKLKSGAALGSGPTMADMAKQKATAGLWGTGSAASTQLPQQSQGFGQKSSGGSAFDDLLG